MIFELILSEFKLLSQYFFDLSDLFLNQSLPLGLLLLKMSSFLPLELQSQVLDLDLRSTFSLREFIRLLQQYLLALLDLSLYLLHLRVFLLDERSVLLLLFSDLLYLH